MKGFFLFFAVGITAAIADPAAELRKALEALRQSSYTWETTTRQRYSEPISPGAETRRAVPDTSLEVEGKNEPNGYVEITLLPSKLTVAAPVTALFKSGDVVGHTPLGWLTRNEIREAERNETDRMVPFEGKSVRLSRCFAAARRAMAMQTPFEEVLDLIGDSKAVREVNGEFIGELSESAVEKLWGDARAKSAPDIQGIVTYRVTNNVLAEFRIKLEISFPSSRPGGGSRSITQWTTKMRAIGSTTVAPPAAAVEKLER